MNYVVMFVMVAVLQALASTANCDVEGALTLKEISGRLTKAYPDHIESADETTLIWRDGTRLPLDAEPKPAGSNEWLEKPSIADMLRVPYPFGRLAKSPDVGADPGRARNQAFFRKIYGDCRSGTVDKELVDVIWLPGKSGQRLRVTRINGVAQKLRRVSEELDNLPAKFDKFLIPSAGTYNCRVIAGTDRVSAHGYGIAIDIAVRHTDYWRWARPASNESPRYRNRIPYEIVEIFERHGFIWGGKWHHFDTMHFEYRPELLLKAR